MIDGLIAILSFLTLPVVLYGLATLVRPFWVVKRRWQGGMLILFSLLVIGVLQSVPAVRPASMTAEEWARRVQLCKSVNATRTCPTSTTELAEATKTIASKAKSTAASGPSVTHEPTKEMSDTFKAAQTALLATFPPCDQAIVKMTNAHGRYAGYNAALMAKQACETAMTAASKVSFDEPIPEDARKDLNESIRCFQFALGAKSQAMEQAAKILDRGEMRPSEVANVRFALKDAYQRDQECGQKYALAAAGHGFYFDLPAPPKKAKVHRR